MIDLIEKKKIWLSSPHMGGAERKYVKDAFDTNWIAPAGPHILNFENTSLTSDINSFIIFFENYSTLKWMKFSC